MGKYKMEYKNTTASELLALLCKPYVQTKDLTRIRSFGLNKAGNLRREIEDYIKNVLNKRPIESHQIPTWIIVDYCDIDIAYLKRMAKIEKELKRDEYQLEKIE